MRVSILSMGSRGDVQPYAALARGLMDAGHEVTLAAHGRFEWLAKEHSIPFVSLTGEPLKAFEGLASVGGACAPLRTWRKARDQMVRALEEWIAAVDGADVVVAHPTIIAAPDIAEYHGIPAVFAHTLPALCPTREYPCCYLLSRSLGPTLNRASYGLIPLALGPLRRIVRQWRQDRLGLPPRRGRTDLEGPGGTAVWHLHGHSPVVLPRPADWPAHWLTTGYWRFPPGSSWSPDPDLARFLDSGKPPVYVGFGSMVYRADRARLTRVLVEALRERGERVVLVRGWALSREGLPEGDDIHFIDAYEGPWHEWLFPRTRAVVHHGGPGTFGAALLSGRPQACIPFAMDQPFWARLAASLGAAPDPLPARRVTSERWRRLLGALLDEPRYERRARRIAADLASENGTLLAVRAIEGIVGHRGVGSALEGPSS